MTPPTDPSVIARGLTEAQRRALLAMTDRWQRPARDTFTFGAAWGLCWIRPAIVDRCRIGATVRHAHDEFRILPLGEQVRDYLLSQQGEKP